MSLIISHVLTYAQLTENVVVSLRRVWVTAHGAFYDRQAQTPDITLYAIRARVVPNAAHGTCRYTFWSHVRLTTDIRLCETGN